MVASPAARAPPAPGRRTRVVVDAAGKFLIPGLWDSHVHLTKLGASSLPVFIANGVTSVRDMGSDLGEVFQPAWRTGQPRSPRGADDRGGVAGGDDQPCQLFRSGA